MSLPAWRIKAYEVEGKNLCYLLVLRKRTRERWALIVVSSLILGEHFAHLSSYLRECIVL